MKKQPETLHINNEDMLFWKHEGRQYGLLVQIDACPMNPRTEFCNTGLMFCQHPRYALGDKDTGCETLGEFWASLVEKNVPNGALLEMLKNRTFKGFMDFNENKRLSDEDLIEEFYDLIKDGGHNGWAARAVTDYAAFLPLWLYDHSGITMSCGKRTYPYDDKWDSSLVGVIAVPKDTAIKELSATKENWKQIAKKQMQDEVRIYDQYLTGEVYQCTVYELDDEDKELDMTKNGDLVSSDDDWTELDCYGSFFGDDIMKNGILESVGLGLEEAIRSGAYETGEAKAHIVTQYDFIRHAAKGGAK